MPPRGARACTAAILAGGRALRFGGMAKGLALVDGVRILDRVAASLAAACDADHSLLLLAGAHDTATWMPLPTGARVIPDAAPGLGALGAIHSALAESGTGVLVVAWDMPYVSVELLRELRARGESADAACPVVDGRLEPLCAYYGARCRDIAAELLASGERRAGALADSVTSVRVEARALANIGDPARLLHNVNSPADLLHADARALLPNIHLTSLHA